MAGSRFQIPWNPRHGTGKGRLQTASKRQANRPRAQSTKLLLLCGHEALQRLGGVNTA